MSTVDDIIAQRDAAIAILNKQIVAANDFKNGGATGMDDKINALVHQRATIAAQAYEAALDDPATARALAALKAITQDMNGVARKMVTATAFIANFSDLIATANKVIPVLQGTG
jgi:hypothetical protein